MLAVEVRLQLVGLMVMVLVAVTVQAHEGSVDAIGAPERASRRRIDGRTRNRARLQAVTPGLVQIGHRCITLYWSARNRRRSRLVDSAFTLPALTPGTLGTVSKLRLIGFRGLVLRRVVWDLGQHA